MPKAVYRSGRRDKCNHLWCDSNPGPLTSQLDALTTRPLRPEMVVTNTQTHAQTALHLSQ